MNEKILEKFQKILEERREVLHAHINTANHSIAEIHDQSLSDHADFTSANSQGMLNSSILQQYENELKDIALSLEKIKNKTFGICQMCGDEIDEARLEIKPHARYCIICREIYEKSQN